MEYGYLLILETWNEKLVSFEDFFWGGGGDFEQPQTKNTKGNAFYNEFNKIFLNNNLYLNINLNFKQLKKLYKFYNSFHMCSCFYMMLYT